MDIKAAIEKTEPHVLELFPNAVSIRLEGAELSDDNRHWLVTFSFLDRDTLNTNPSLLAAALAIRAYKTFKLRASNGEFVGFRNGYANAA